MVYCTHIFDHLENWATHILQMSKGTPKRFGKLDELPDYQAPGTRAVPVARSVCKRALGRPR